MGIFPYLLFLPYKGCRCMHMWFLLIFWTFRSSWCCSILAYIFRLKIWNVSLTWHLIWRKCVFLPSFKASKLCYPLNSKRFFISYLYHQIPRSCDDNSVVSFPSSQYSNYVVVLIFSIMLFIVLASGQDVVGTAVSVSSLHPQT